MKLNYSYRSFLITSLLIGNLVLFLYSVKLSGEKTEDVATYDMEIIEEFIIPEEEIAALPTEKVKIETNRAYNEAEKFISEIENENRETTETTEGKLESMNEAINNALNGGNNSNLEKKPQEEKKAKFSNSTTDKDKTAVVNGGNRNTTISYQLVNRKDLDLPNPVYTCYGSGKVVISIEVNAIGKVTKCTYSKTASTTTNECLIDSAIEYAGKARFNTDSKRATQLGSITFNFPGQQ